METIYVEIRAAEGGDDAKSLVDDQLKAYASYASRRGL
jgi:protein subunit release factor A